MFVRKFACVFSLSDRLFMFKKLLEYLRLLFFKEHTLPEDTPAPPPPVIPDTLPSPENPTWEDPVIPTSDTPEDASDAADNGEVTVTDEEKGKVITGPAEEIREESEAAEESEPAPPVTPTTAHIPRYLWCLDGGHGKLTPGKRSPVYDVTEQFFEYEFNHDIILRITKRLDTLGVQYFIVEPHPETVGKNLKERVNRANNKRSALPKIFVSVHSNAGPTASPNDWVNGRISGTETWYYHGSAKGKKLAAIFQKKLIAYTGWKNRHIKSRRRNQFYVLRKTKMPAILTENGFYNNRDQVIALQTDAVRQLIAEAHVQAIWETEKQGLGEVKTGRFAGTDAEKSAP